jgi:hypothetical protein
MGFNLAFQVLMWFSFFNGNTEETKICMQNIGRKGVLKRGQLGIIILHVVMWTEFSWLRGGYSGGYLQIWKLPFA